jgi:hypothetical protein
MPLKLCKPAKHRQHQPSVWRCSIAPRITERLERCAKLRDLDQGVEQIAS